jgi:uncharacterized protein YdcH (DUF465 family)
MQPCQKVSFANEDEVNAIVNTIRQEGNLFSMSTEQLSRTFISKCLCDDFSHKSFEDIRDAYIEATNKGGIEDYPNSLDDLCAYILRIHFRYCKDHKSVLIVFYDSAVKDWNEVDDRIKKIEDELTSLNKAENSTAKHERIHLLHFYLKHTKIALDEIIIFLRKEIHEFVLRKCSYPKNTESWDTYAYHYYASAPAYDVQQPSMISNKFTLIDRRDDIVEMYDNKKEEFYPFLHKYIEDNYILHTVKDASRINYFFDNRSEFLREALDAYENENYILFSSACFLIVEGILHDVCLKLGVPESEIIGAGFQKKVDKIFYTYKVDIDYQYYSFRFRLLRNEVVHGTASAQQLQEVADLLLLDLLDMMHVTKSNQILFNPKLNFLHYAQLNSPDRLEYVVGYLILSDIEVPAIYDTVESHSNVLRILEQDDFWDYVDKLCDSEISYERATGLQVLKKVKELGMQSLEEKCASRLRKYKDIKDKFVLNRYLKGMLQYTFSE